MFKLISAAIVGFSLATSASADSARMSAPIQAGSLHDGPLDMVAYWVPQDDGYEVTATFIGRMPGEQPMRIVMLLGDGDDVSFSMPGYRSALYTFARSDDAVDVSVEISEDRVAAR